VVAIVLFRTPVLDADDLEVVAMVQDLHKSLRYAVQEPKRWFGLLRRVALARSIRGSNSIEGYVVSLDDAFAAVADEEPLEASAEAWAAVLGYREAMTFVLQLVDDDDWAYDQNLLRSLHFMMLSHDLDNSPGRWRRGDIFVVDEDRGKRVYEGPPPETVPRLIKELVVALNAPSDGTPVMVRAAMAHLNFVMIHPHRDGNGRMARALQALVLAREGVQAAPEFCSIEEYLGANEQAYYDVLASVGAGAWHPERDAHEWVRFSLVAHFRQARTVLRRAREAQRFWSLAEGEIEQRKLPERMVAPLHHCVSGFMLRNSTYRDIAEGDITENLASRDLKALVEAGMLQAHGEKRGRYYTPVDRLREQNRAVKRAVRSQVRLDEDPYDLVAANRQDQLPL
jgi:Fic family protein